MQYLIHTELLEPSIRLDIYQWKLLHVRVGIKLSPNESDWFTMTGLRTHRDWCNADLGRERKLGGFCFAGGVDGCQRRGP